MRRRPQRAGRIEKVAVGLDVDDDALLVAMPQRQAHRDADPGADRRGAAAADQPIGLVDGPEPLRTIAAGIGGAAQPPLLFLYDLPQVPAQPPAREWTPKNEQTPGR